VLPKLYRGSDLAQFFASQMGTPERINIGYVSTTALWGAHIGSTRDLKTSRASCVDRMHVAPKQTETITSVVRRSEEGSRKHEAMYT